MTIIPVAECCRQLGIDAKTLRRWLLHAQLPLQRHPHDGRKKGVSNQHLQRLATLHHRALPALLEQGPALPAPGVAAPWPTELLTLPASLATLQTHLTALQQQMAQLTHMVQQLAQPPAKAAKRPPTPTLAASRSRPSATAKSKPPSKPAHVIPLVEASRDGQYVLICPKQGRLSFEPESPQWFAWLDTQSSFRFVGKRGRFTAHHEGGRVPHGAWRAHRHIRNHSYTLRLAPTADLTIAVLEQAAATLQAHLS